MRVTSEFDCLILRNPMVCVVHYARVHKQWSAMPKYDVAEVTTFVTSRPADSNVDFANNLKSTNGNEDWILNDENEH